MLDCSITIITKNDSRNIGACLESVFAQKEIGLFEVVIVDSGSTDGTVEIARRFPTRIQQIPAREFHHARTRNLAASLTSGPIIVGLSQDAIPASEYWLRNMLANFADRRVGAVYGRQLPKPGAPAERQDTFETIYGDKKIIKDPALANTLGYRFYHFSDVNSAIRRSIWQEMPFPEDLKTFEDLGIAKRILDSGWKIVYEPESPVLHSHNHGTKALFKRYVDIGYTLKYLGIWDIPGTRSSLIRDLKSLVQKQFERNGGERWRLGGGIKKNLAKSAGLLIGLNEHLLPFAVKRHLSAARIFD
jgi:rhamnosyltransferase